MSISSPGITVNTVSREKKMAFMRHTAMSGPRRNRMNSMAINPPMVVRLLAPTSGMALLRERITASRRSWVAFSSLKRLQ